MWFPHAIWPALFAVVLGASILIQLFRSGIRRPGSTAAFMLFISFFIWSFGEMVERLAGPPPADEWLAWTGARILFIGVSIAPAAFIHFSMEYPYLTRWKWRKPVVAGLYSISALFALLGLWNPDGMIISDMEPYSGLGQEIWGLVGSGIFTAYMLYVFAMSLVFLAIMLYKYFHTSLKIVRMQIFIVLSGFVIAVTLVASTTLIPSLEGVPAYPLTTVSFTIFSLFVLYTIFRYRTFLVSPEEGFKTQSRSSFKITDRESGERELLKLVGENIPAMAFVSVEPAEFKKKVGVDIPVFRLCRESGPDHLNPLIDEQIEMIRFIISSFAERTEGAVVFADVKGAMESMDAMPIYEALLEEFRRLAPELNILFIIAE